MASEVNRCFMNQGALLYKEPDLGRLRRKQKRRFAAVVLRNPASLIAGLKLRSKPEKNVL